MDLFDVVRSCFRRWYLVLPLLLITAWLSYHIYSAVKPVYYSNAVVSLAQPNSRLDQSQLGVPVPQNGLLESGGAPLIANLVVFGLRDPSVVEQVVAAGGQGDYTAKMFPVDSGMQQLPLIMIEATESDPAAAAKTVQLAVAQADPALRNLQQQAGVPDDQMVRALSVSPPSAPAAATPSRTRSTIAIFLAGAGLSVLLGLMSDVLLTRYTGSRRNHRPTQVPPADEAVSRLQADTRGEANAGNQADSDNSRERRSANDVSVERT